MIALVWLVVATASTGAFAASSSSRSRRLSAKSRLSLALSGLDAAVTLVVLHAFGPWNDVSRLWWLLPVTIGALGMGAAVITWPNLPTIRPDRPVWLTMGLAIPHMTLLFGILGVTLV
jgi:hypothetical protein